MTVRDEVRRIRRSVAWSRLEPAIVAVQGPSAAEAVDRALTGDLFLRESEARAALLLREDGTVEADVLAYCEGDDWLLLADGISGAALAAIVGPAAVDRTEELVVIGVDGPFAWELLGLWDSVGASGLPYHTGYLRDGVRVIRAGRTGEYGYVFVAPRAMEGALVARLVELGARYPLERVSEEALACCALESGFLDLGLLGGIALDPGELQLRSRLLRGKECRGSAALERRLAGQRRRTTAFRTEGPLSPGEVVTCEGEPIGLVLVARPDPGGEGWFGQALLELRYAVSGIDRYRVGERALRTVSMPLIRNRSLYVRAMRHTWADEPTLPWPYRD